MPLATTPKHPLTIKCARMQNCSFRSCLNRSWNWLLFAWVLSLSATLGALFLGEIMGMTPCVLCWYQRICMFPLAIILGVACFREDRQGAIYALWLSLAGLAVSAYHTLLVADVIPKTWVPCGAGVSCADQKLDIFDGIQIPWLSLLTFVVISILLMLFLRKTQK
jgi:disulfide bond formation protein DsbB